MANRQYVGARYVPKFADPVEWNSALSYEALTIVTHLGNSFTSKKPVPAGVDIGNGEYWANTGNYNAQVTELANQVTTYKTQVTELTKYVDNKCVPITAYGGVGDNSTDNTNAFIQACDALTSGTIIIPAGTYLVNGNVNIPNSITLMFNGGSVNVNGSFSCGKIVAPKTTIFSGNGNININNSMTPVGYPEWFNDDIAECYNHFDVIELAAKDYILSKDLNITRSNVKIYGIAPNYYAAAKTRIVLTGGIINVGDINGRTVNDFPRAITMQNFTIDQTNSNKNCLNVYGVINGMFENLLFTGDHVKNTVTCSKTIYTKFIDCTSFVVRAQNDKLEHFHLTDNNNPILAGGNASLYFVRCNASTAGYPGGIGWFNSGVTSDVHLDSCESSFCTGFNFYSASPSEHSYNNIVITNCVFDACPDNGAVISVPYNGTFVIANTYIALADNVERACLQYGGGDTTLLVDNCQFVSTTAHGIGFQSLGKVQGKISATVNGPAVPYSIDGDKTNMKIVMWNKGTLVV